MKIDPAASSDPGVPFEFDLCMSRSPRLVVDEARHAIAMLGLRSFTTADGDIWIKYPDLIVALGQGRGLNDPGSAYFIPADARRQIIYTTELIVDAGLRTPPEDREMLEGAKRTAATLQRMREYLPPWPYDLRQPWSEDVEFPLATLIKQGRIDAYPGGRCWWVVESEAAKLLPPGESFDDATSSWYIGPHDRAGHGEVLRLSADHIRHWPEIYGSRFVPRVS